MKNIQLIQFGHYGIAGILHTFGNIAIIDQVKFLGIFLDRALSWQSQIKNTIIKINQNTFYVSLRPFQGGLYTAPLRTFSIQ